MYRESVGFELFVISILQKINKRNNQKKAAQFVGRPSFYFLTI